MTPWGAEEETDSQALFGRTILQIAPALDAGASALACVEVAACLAEAGARALVAGAPGPLASELQARGGVFLPLPAPTRNPWKAMRDRQSLERMALEEGVELIHVRGAAGLDAALQVARRARIPLVAEYAAGRALALDADSILAFSRAAMEEALKLRPDAEARLHLGLEGVDLRRFAPETFDANRVRRLREALGVKSHMRLVIGVGLPDEARRAFLAAAAHLKEKGFFASEAQEARFVWFCAEGDSADRAAFDAEAAKLGLTQDVSRFAGDDRAAACLAAAVAIVSSGDARLCVEAQALGAPLVALLPSVAMETIDEVLAPPRVEAALRSGWLVASSQPQTLARAVEEAVRLGATARGNLGQRARAHASAFSMERMCALTLAVYAGHFSSRRA